MGIISFRKKWQQRLNQKREEFIAGKEKPGLWKVQGNDYRGAGEAEVQTESFRGKHKPGKDTRTKNRRIKAFLDARMVRGREGKRKRTGHDFMNLFRQ